MYFLANSSRNIGSSTSKSTFLIFARELVSGSDQKLKRREHQTRGAGDAPYTPCSELPDHAVLLGRRMLQATYVPRDHKDVQVGNT